MQSAAPGRSLTAIAARLRLTREALGLSQAELCRLTGIETNTYNQWEKAKGRPELDKAFLLCDRAGYTLDWIYSGVIAGLPHSIASKLTNPGTEPRPRALKGGRG